MARFILDYDLSDKDFKNIVKFNSIEEAESNTENWCMIDADTIENAKSGLRQILIKQTEYWGIQGK